VVGPPPLPQGGHPFCPTSLLTLRKNHARKHRRERDPRERPHSEIQVRRQGIVWEFLDFLVHNKVWWMTPIILVILLMVVFILVAESSPVLPFIYTVI